MIPVAVDQSGLPHYISLGAGVQSSTMALMSACGEITPRPSAAIFADTGSEPRSVMDWLCWLEESLPFPVYRVGPATLAEDEFIVRVSKKSGNHYLRSAVPMFIKNRDGSKGIIPRKCTRDYKITPVMQKVKELCGLKRASNKLHAISWIGISTDEAHRMKPSRVPYIQHRYPLVEMGMTRQDCLKWMKARAYPEPPRSACVFCPYHSNDEWRRLRAEEPEEFERAAVFEERIHAAQSTQQVMEGKPFLHASLVPLREVDLSIAAERGQPDLWGEECEGMCGV